MGHFKKNQKGFSLVEVMIAAGIMGVMAVFFYKYFADQMKQQKTVMLKMEEGNLLNEIRLLLMNQSNCAETFKDQVLNLNKDGYDPFEEPVIDLKKVYIKPIEGEEPEKEVVPKYLKWIQKDQEKKYGNGMLKIADYNFRYSKDQTALISKFKRAEINLEVIFDRGKNAYGNAQKPYRIPLEIEVDDSKKLVSCSSMGLPAGGEAGLVALDAKVLPGYEGKTGNEACKTKNLACAYLISTNFVSNSSGTDAPLYTPACMSSYNKSLQGVKNGVGVSNIHSCDAKVGSFTTFELNLSGVFVECGATFVAICN